MSARPDWRDFELAALRGESVVYPLVPLVDEPTAKPRKPRTIRPAASPGGRVSASAAERAARAIKLPAERKGRR